MSEQEKYSSGWVEQRVQEVGATHLLHHDCGFCGHWVRYLFNEDGVFFSSACDCAWSPERPDSYMGIAQWLAMQRSDEVRDSIMEGLRT